MTRNVMFCFLQNLTTSRKQQHQLQGSSTSSKISDGTIFGVSKAKGGPKTKLKCEIANADDSISKTLTVNGKAKKKSSSKSKFFLRKSRSTNSVSLSVRSPLTDSKQRLSPKQQNLVSSSESSCFAVNNDKPNGNNSGDIDSKPTKRKSLSDVQANLTQSSIKNDLSKKSQIDCSQLKPVVSNMMPNMTGPEAGTVPSSTQEYLLPPTNVSLSSNSSLNSSSVKSTNTKSNDGTSTDKKRKQMSSSRQKKFHRRFKQVAMDEELINYFSCAFVSDILLQGYMYITKNYIAFYSNVFGYVTKLLIPVTSVARISKEKTVKIFPNAIAVATVDERHVFSSFLSREAAYQLMISVWKEALPMSEIDMTASAAQLRVCTAIHEKSKTQNSFESKSSIFEKVTMSSTLQVVNQRRKNSISGISEIDDESSSAISGNEGLAQLIQSKNALLNGEAVSNDQSNANNSSSSCNSNNTNPSSNDLVVGREQISDVNILKESNSFTSTPKSNGFCFNGNSTITFFKLKIPRTIHIAYFGLSLVIILALMAGFLFYHISEIKNARQMGIFANGEINTEIPNVNMYAEMLKWQKDMQTQRVQLTKNVLANNLEQISQISDSLQTLSSLIHSNEVNNNVNDEISSILSDCNSLEACLVEQTPEQP
ncbi:GRAM domain-containing protein 2B-like isoform X2 [Contarinia nasturtii]|uniref:GRAM domain-containing protein 2B-like isoform X2 n=1 Tax=Contarinia nasturtii TaxID=265458 RepID=UPI0012D3A5B7|nr:GRAM domain-containing protein 2B-like isoform X2 [Contarinia nasturtii]XP_031626245.1 GRAM domain-containing protein 2B-like isoform X2 [Contarinia nasturtii]XP_031626246.1 GRAM domain-containing protein 2B-like isoform X2 [Contarinia nasturtii]XP_031626247.1 GRAM domain-containing protein 2B-like isoform X2 [Contarinia nasturtii]